MNIEGREISIYGVADKPLPVVYLHTFRQEGGEVWRQCQRLQARRFILVAIDVPHWADDMTPWPSEPLFDDGTGYGGKGAEWLRRLTQEVIPTVEEGIDVAARVIAGYSLAGLFAFWSAYNTEVFDGIVSGSGSFWYPGFMDYAQSHVMPRKPAAVYFSLGDKEHVSRFPRLAEIEELTLQLSDECLQDGINAFFRLNNGNHYNQTEWRMAKGIQWMLREMGGKKANGAI